MTPTPCTPVRGSSLDPANATPGGTSRLPARRGPLDYGAHWAKQLIADEIEKMENEK